MYSLIRRALATMGLVNDTSVGDYESAEYVDAANLSEMECRWSPNMGLLLGDFEETRPHGRRLNVPLHQ